MKKPFFKLGITICAVSAVLFGIMVFQEYMPYLQSEKGLYKIREIVSSEPEKEDVVNPMDRKIDFDSLKQINPDIIGWIYIPGIDVDQPVLKGSTDTEYLAKDFQGNYNSAGSIFTFAGTKLTDPRICFFGHNLSTGGMFGNLHKYTDKEFMEQNQTCWFYTPKETKEIKITGTMIVRYDDEVFQEGDDESSMQYNDQEMLLVTCVGYENTPERLMAVGHVVSCLDAD